ncbi:MAG: hypothetical protein M3Q78_11050 [Acidobacteriota bacterium]|nr:hypothetical protein [Acidobacteriota bacterium]
MENINKNNKSINYDKTCAHIPCQCLLETGGDYCSPACEKAGDSTDCLCGHDECRAQA